MREEWREAGKESVGGGEIVSSLFTVEEVGLAVLTAISGGVEIDGAWGRKGEGGKKRGKDGRVSRRKGNLPRIEQGLGRVLVGRGGGGGGGGGGGALSPCTRRRGRSNSCPRNACSPSCACNTTTSSSSSCHSCGPEGEEGDLLGADEVTAADKSLLVHHHGQLGDGGEDIFKVGWREGGKEGGRGGREES